MFRNRTAVALPAQILRRGIVALACLLCLLGCSFAQESATVPNLVKFSGTISASPAGTVGMIFALYQDQTGGTPLWQEVQNVAVDANGHYTSLLGSNTAAGIPLDVFSSNEARWLGVQVQGQAEQPRVLLVSVPYALKAADAQTLGGLPPSAFLRADAATATTSSVNSAAVNAAVRPAVAGAIPSLTPIDDAGWLAGYLPVFDASGNLQDSYLNQLINTTTTPPTAYLGFNTPAPQFNLHFTTTVDPAAITIDAYGHVGINFIGRRADGTQASPTAVVAGDNLFTLNGRGWFQSANPTVTPSGFSDTSRGNLKIFAAEPAPTGWTDTAEGTYITMATTQIGTVNTTEKMRITDAGDVGIGTTTPDQMLTVAGNIHATGTLQADGGIPAASISGTIGDSQISAISGAKVTGTVAAALTATTAATATNAVSLNGLPSTSYARTDVGNSLNGTQAITGNATVTGDVTAATFHGNGSALTGLTVPTSTIVHLTTQGKAAVNPATMTQLHQYISGGTFGPPYVVPSGESLVITSIEVSVLTAGANNYLNLYDNTTIGQNEFWYLPNIGTTQLQFPTGIVYPAGTGVYVYIGGSGTTTQMFVDVHGYLTTN